jgi:hypothetical protein
LDENHPACDHILGNSAALDDIDAIEKFIDSHAFSLLF